MLLLKKYQIPGTYVRKGNESKVEWSENRTKPRDILQRYVKQFAYNVNTYIRSIIYAKRSYYVNLCI